MSKLYFCCSEALFFQTCVNSFCHQLSRKIMLGEEACLRTEWRNSANSCSRKWWDWPPGMACNYLPHPAQAGDQVPGDQGEGVREGSSDQERSIKVHGTWGRGAAHLSWPVDTTPGPAVKTTVESSAGTVVVGGPGTVSGSWEAPVCCADAWSVGSFGDYLDLSSSK